jgi:DNA replication initiation complex subunit (GINS family)
MKIRMRLIVIISILIFGITGCDKNPQTSVPKKGQRVAQDLATTDKTIAFLKTFGGDMIDIAKDMIPTSDGGYIMAGYTTSIGAGGSDAYLVKINGKGDVTWDLAYGMKDNDTFWSVAETSDGGYIAAGKIENGADKDKNMYVVKVAGDGHAIWERSFGSIGEDEANNIIRTKDGGYIVVGLTNSKGAGSGDAWVVKLSKTGDLLWDQTFGTKENDFANAVIQTKDGGYAVTGFSGEKSDIFVVKLDAKGGMIWNKFIGTANYETGSSIIQADDGSLVVSGMTQEKPNVKVDAFIVKLSTSGELVWSKAIRTDNFSSAMNIKQTPDGGYITCGTIVTGEETSGGGDIYFLKLTPNGELQWSKIIGGPDVEYGNVVVLGPGKMYVFAGYIGYRDPNKAGNFDILYGQF